ncbi:hypothetical protein [Roseateles sp. P5_E1]
MRLSLLSLLSLLIACLTIQPAPAQADAADAPVRVSLSVKSGRAAFKAGEPIALDLRFHALQAPERIVTNSLGDYLSDEVVITALEGSPPAAIDHERWMPQQHDVINRQAVPEGQELSLPLVLDQRYRFDRPGRYSVHVVTRRAGRKTLTTNDVTFAVEMPSPDEDAARVRMLAAEITGARSGRKAAAAVQALAQMSSDAATQAKLDLVLEPQGAHPYRIDILRGLWHASDRQRVIEALEKAVMDPAPARTDLIDDLVLLKSSVEASWPADWAADAALSKRIRATALHRLAATLPLRDGESRLQASWLVLGPFRGDAAAMDVADFVVARDFIAAHLDKLQGYQLVGLARDFRGAFDGLAIVAALQHYLDAHPDDANALSLAVNQYPDLAQPYVVRHACGDHPMYFEQVRDLPVATLAGVDDCLRRKLLKEAPTAATTSGQIGLGVTLAFVARFATPDLIQDVARLMPSLQGRWLPNARAAALVYLMRWDPKTYSAQFEVAAQQDEGDVMSYTAKVTSHLPADAMRAFYRRTLENGSAHDTAQAAMVLASIGAADDRPLLNARLQRLREALRAGRGSHDDENLEASLVFAILDGYGWPREEGLALVATCVSSFCKTSFHVQ